MIWNQPHVYISYWSSLISIPLQWTWCIAIAAYNMITQFKWYQFMWCSVPVLPMIYDLVKNVKKSLKMWKRLTMFILCWGWNEWGLVPLVSHAAVQKHSSQERNLPAQACVLTLLVARRPLYCFNEYWNLHENSTPEMCWVTSPNTVFVYWGTGPFTKFDVIV